MKRFLFALAFIVAGRAEADTTFYSSDYSGETVGAVPSHWSGGATVVASAGIGGAKNALQYSSGDGRVVSQYENYDTNDPIDNAGNVKAVSVVRLGAAPNGSAGAAFHQFLRRPHYDNWRGNTTVIGSRVFSETYIGWGQPGGVSIRRYPGDGSSVIVLASVDGATSSTFSSTEWYTITFSAVGSNLTLRCSRASDGFYLNSSGNFQSTPVDACSATDDHTIAAGTPNYEFMSFQSAVVTVDSQQYVSLSAVQKISPPQTAFKNGRRVYTWGGTQFLAHGNIIFDTASGYYYFWGFDQTGTSSPQTGFWNVATVGIHLFKSRNLVDWSDEGLVYTNDTSVYKVVERPHVFQNPTTKQWLLFAHVEDSFAYTLNKTAIFTASRPEGPFVFYGYLNPTGIHSRDFTVFVDGANAYWLYNNSASSVNGYALSSDWKSTTGSEQVVLAEDREAPDIIKQGSVYFLITSLTAGWDPNLNRYDTASSPLGTYTTGTNPFQTSSEEPNDFAYRSQPMCFFRTSTGALYLAADRWNEYNLWDSPHLFLPVTFPTSSTMSITYADTVAPTAEVAPLPAGSFF